MGKIAFVFPGQGSQYIGMGREIYEFSVAARRVLDDMPDAKRLIFESLTEAELKADAQTVIFAADLMCAAALTERGVTAGGAAGFSLGEIPAAVFCGILDQKAAYDFVNFRAAAMKQCADDTPGGMFAVLGLSADDVEKICTKVIGAYPANYNCPGQTVVSCAEQQYGELTGAFISHGGKSVKLAVSGPFHSPYMERAAQRCAEYLTGVAFKKPCIPLYANATGQPYGDARTLLARQIDGPVLWRKTIERMAADGFDVFVEAGPGAVLSGLIKRIDASLTVLNVCDGASLEKTLDALGAFI